MDWATHVSSFLAQWVLRYIKPGDGSWKYLLDHYLLHDSRGRELYPVGRVALAGNLTTYQRKAMLARLPSTWGGEYMRSCLREYWKLNLTPVNDPEWQGIESDLFWHTAIDTKYRPRPTFANTVSTSWGS